MALPAMITDFGAQSANYGAAVGQSLAQLGQQVGQQLAMREYQRQASAALPAMQSSFQSALSKIQSGDVSDAYIDLLNTQMQFGSTTNPFIQSAMANFSDLALKAGEMKKSELFRQAQYGGGTGGGPLPAMGPSGAATAMGRLYGRTPTETTETVTTDTVTTSNPPGQPTATLLPPGAVVEPDSMPTGEGGAEGGLTIDQAAQPDAAMAGVSGMEPDSVQIATRNSMNQAMNATAEDQTKAFQSAIAGPQEASNWQPQTIEGFSRFFPKENISDTMAIAPVQTRVKFGETWVGQTDKPGARFTGTKDFLVDDKMNLHATEYARGLQADVNVLINTGPTNTDDKWVDIIEQSGGAQNVNISKEGEGDRAIYTMKPRGKDAITVNKDVYDAVAKIKGFSAIAAETGIKILPENISGLGVRGRKFGSVEEALTSGVPFGETVYVLEAGRYRPRTFTSQDRQALEWANANPNDPMAAKIKTRLGIK